MFDISAALNDIANGDRNALKFMADFYFWVHAKDDLRDQEGDLTAIVGSEFAFLQTVSSNEFYLLHKSALLPVLQTSLLAYLASEKLKNSASILDRITAQVLKSEYINVLFTVAAITGGFGHAARMSDKYRIYSFDNEPVKENLATGASTS